MRLNTPPATLVAPDSKSISTASVEPRLTESQLDALEWAKNFMERYEKKHGK